MSFRIDDILKKDEKVSSSSKCEKSQKCTTSSSPNLHNFKADVAWKNLSPPSQCSNNILQQTLQNKLHVPPHLPYYLPLAEYPTTKFCSNLYNYDVILPLQTLNSYVDRGCSSLYSRTRYWPPHGSCPAFFPLSYPHYSKRKGGQVRFTTSQTEALEKRFGAHKYLSPEDRRILANSLKLSDRQVKTWFQNRRAKWRRCNSVSSNSSETINKEVSNYESDNELDEVNHSRSASPSMLLKAGEHSTQ